jgi:hypothetical protein
MNFGNEQSERGCQRPVSGPGWSGEVHLSVLTVASNGPVMLAPVSRPAPRTWSAALLKNMFCPVSMNHAAGLAGSGSREVLGHGFSDKDIRAKARIEERPDGLVMNIKVYAAYDGQVSVNDWPLINRGDTLAIWSNAHLFVDAHLANLARELEQRRAAQTKSPRGRRTSRPGLPGRNGSPGSREQSGDPGELRLTRPESPCGTAELRRVPDRTGGCSRRNGMSR